MFPFFPLFSEPVRIKAEPVRRPVAREPFRAHSRPKVRGQAADMKARLRAAAKSAFRLMGED